MEQKGKIPSKDATAKARKINEDQLRFDDAPLQDAGADPRMSKNGLGRETSEQSRDAEPPGSGPKRSLLKKALFFGVPTLFVLALISGFLVFKFDLYAEYFHDPVPKLEPVTSIKRPIPVPDYREMADFLLLYEVDGRKVLTAFRMEFGFQSPNRYRSFKEQNVAFRDMVYSFLQKQNLPGNSVKSWHSVVENDLVDFLKVKLPQSQADTIRLTQVENL